MQRWFISALPSALIHMSCLATSEEENMCLIFHPHRSDMTFVTVFLETFGERSHKLNSRIHLIILNEDSSYPAFKRQKCKTNQNQPKFPNWSELLTNCNRNVRIVRMWNICVNISSVEYSKILPQYQPSGLNKGIWKSPLNSFVYLLFVCSNVF